MQKSSTYQIKWYLVQSVLVCINFAKIGSSNITINSFEDVTNTGPFIQCSFIIIAAIWQNLCSSYCPNQVTLEDLCNSSDPCWIENYRKNIIKKVHFGELHPQYNHGLRSHSVGSLKIKLQGLFNLFLRGYEEKIYVFQWCHLMLVCDIITFYVGIQALRWMQWRHAFTEK